MVLSRVRTGIILMATATGSAGAADPPPTTSWSAKAVAASGSATRTVPARPGLTAAPTLLDVVTPGSREVVSSVVRQPSLMTKATEEPFSASAQVYDFLLEHPDRTAQAWRRMGVPCVEITDLGHGRFGWTDNAGSEVTWHTIGRFPDGIVWLANGKVKPGALLPPVPVKAVAILHAPRTADANGSVTIVPSVRVYVQTDSRAAATVLRLFGPAIPRMAEQGAEQLLLFFSGVASYLKQYPDKTESLLAPLVKK